MAIYLKKFKNVAEYNAYIASGGTKPKAYLTTDDNVVYYLDEAQGRTEEFDGYAKTTDLAKVAFDGEYESLNNLPTIPTLTSELTNDSGYLTQHQDISGKQNKLVSGTNIKTINNNSILGSGNIEIVSTVDSTLSSSSMNPVQNKVINSALASKSDTGHTHDERYYTETEVNAKLSGKSDTGHTHDGRYYTENEIDSLFDNVYTTTVVDTALAGKSDTGHTHDERYYTEDEIDTKLASINTGKTVEIVNSATTGYGASYSVTTKSITLAADKYYIVGRISGLTIILPDGADSDGEEYCCQFYIPNSSYTLTLPSTVYWQNGTAPSFEKNTCCQLVIVNNCATIGTFKASS